MTLYELTMAAQQLQDLLESEEIDQETYNDTLESMDADTKLENVCKVMRNLEAQAEAYKAEKLRLAEKQKVTENSISRLKESLLNFLQVTGNKKVQQGLFTISRSPIKSVVVEDLSKLPTEYIKVKQEADKTALAKALKAGEELEGARLEEREYVRVK